MAKFVQNNAVIKFRVLYDCAPLQCITSQPSWLSPTGTDVTGVFRWRRPILRIRCLPFVHVRLQDLPHHVVLCAVVRGTNVLAGHYDVIREDGDSTHPLMFWAQPDRLAARQVTPNENIT